MQPYFRFLNQRVVEEFVRIYGRCENNVQLLELAAAQEFVGEQKLSLEVYYPFDPCLLEYSERLIAPHYRRWEDAQREAGTEEAAASVSFVQRRPPLPLQRVAAKGARTGAARNNDAGFSVMTAANQATNVVCSTTYS
jgi:hypothetical protein